MSDAEDASAARGEPARPTREPNLSKDPLARELEQVEMARHTWGEQAEITFIPGTGGAGDTVIIESVEDLGRHFEDRLIAAEFHRRFRDWFWKREKEVSPGEDELALTFEEIEAGIGPLPQAAKENRLWWSNSPTENRARIIWLRVGWQVDRVLLADGLVQFRRHPENAE
jgi:hypothetical protein